MERLDACYFCGTATDAPLREVSISPRARQGDPDATVRVTLCPACERKLERVLGGLFDHVESRRVDREAPDETDEPPARATGGDGPTRSASGSTIDRIDVSSDAPTGRQGRRRLFTDQPDGSDSTASDGVSETADAGTDDDDAEILDEGPRVRARTTPGRAKGLDNVSVDEYNRVVRLLQNREFPVPRQTFVNLAADAYDLGEETVEQVLDTAIERGALGEREGQLVRPDEESP